MEENKNALDEVNKGCTMGIEAINNFIDKIDNKNFKEELEEQLGNYQKTTDKINEIYNDYSTDTPHEISGFTKKMTDYMMNTKTMMDHTDSKIAEILLQGTNMGIIEGRRIINNKKLDKKVKSIMEEFINDQEHSVENIKKYL